MRELWSALCAVVVVWCLCCTVKGYPLGDLTQDGLLAGSRVITVSRRRRQIDSSSSNSCTYPGSVAITVSGRVLYTGLHQDGTVRVPTDALEILKMSNVFRPLTVYGDDGTGKATIDKGTVEDAAVTNNDGTTTIKLSTDFSSARCPSNNAILYDSATMDVDVSACKMASYGGSQTKIHTYNGILQTEPLATNNVKGCCADVLPNILSKVPNLGHPSASVVDKSFTCARSGEGVCNGDIGAPIYCTDRRSGQQVVVGMVDSGTCSKGEYVGAIDFTRGTLMGFSS